MHIDFSAAFYRIHHSALTYNLRYVGFVGVIFDVIYGFLCGRLQGLWLAVYAVRMFIKVVSGVPQVSVLSPLLLLTTIQENPPAGFCK